MDIKMVTRMARAMVLQWGMSDKLGFVSYAGEDSQNQFLPEKDYSPDTNRVIDEEIRRLSDEAFEETRSLVSANWDKIVAVAEALLDHETLSRDEVDRIMKGEKLRPSVRNLMNAELARPKPATPAPAADAGPGLDPGLGGAMPSPA
jgi:cell division protease FtsH